MSFNNFYLNVLDFGAVGDGETDATAAFQAALDEAGKTGDVVYAPPGRYLFKSSLRVPISTTLMGSLGNVSNTSYIYHDGRPKAGDLGTTFLVTGGRGSEKGEAFINLHHNSTLKSVLIFYPEQDPESTPVPYPYCIAMRGDNSAVLDVEMLNPYNGIDATSTIRHFIARVYGQPLRRGIILDKVYDIGRIEDVHFNPWWSRSQPVLKFMVEEGEAFIMGRTDWQYVVNCFAIVYKIGFLFKDFGHGGPNVMLTQSGHDTAPYSVVVENTMEHAGLTFNNCQFMGEFLIKESNRGPVRVNGCGFWTTPPGEFENPGSPTHFTSNSSGHVVINACHFSDFYDSPEAKQKACIIINNSSANISNCDFLDKTKPQVQIGDKTNGVIIIGNRFNGGEKIIGNKSKAQIGFNLEN